MNFLNNLNVKLKDGSDSIWVLCRPLEYWSELAGLIIVPTGFETDFASVPRLPFIYTLWGDRVHREAVLHDYLYRKQLPFGLCNKIFLEAMKSRGVPWHIRYPMYWGVCIGGFAAYKRYRDGR